MRNLLLLSTSFCLLISLPGWAEKPQHASQGKDKTIKAEQKLELSLHHEEGEGHADKEDKMAKQNKDKMKKKHDDMDGHHSDMHEGKKGLEKQQDKKAEQARNEMGKGSEKGQQQREENSKKWWKFWGE